MKWLSLPRLVFVTQAQAQSYRVEHLHGEIFISLHCRDNTARTCTMYISALFYWFHVIAA